MGRLLLEEIRKGSKSAMMKQRIITHLIYNGSSTITDLSKDMDLSVPTVTKFVDEMCAEGYVNDYGKLETSGGRHPSLYGLNSESGYFIGVEVKWYALNIGVINFKGDVVQLQMDIPFKLEDTPECLELLCQHIEDFMAGLAIDKNKLLGINVVLCGRVNPELGYSYSFFNFGGTSLSSAMTERLKVDVSIDNDGRAMLYGEFMKGVVKGQRHVIFINVSWGLGMSIIIDGKLYQGKSGFAGEFGHNYGYDNQVICNCGKRGCIETEVSCSALYRKFIEHLRNGENSVVLAGKTVDEITLQDVFEAIAKEDLLAIELVEEIASQLGLHVAAIINVFNPEMVILGGDLSCAGDYLLQPIITAVRKYTLNLMNRDSDIVLSKLKDRAGVIGACLLARSKMFALN
ncbi:MAG: ROK family transcriptional regulator [Phocaeicola sp.]|nr:ROK family transcriptional regulator [Phocaeicola sp.]